MLCTASILTLLAVSVDRYLAISLPLGYHRRVTPCRVALALAAIWTSSLTVSFLPIHLGWNTVDYSVQHADWGVGTAQQGGRYCHYEWNNKYVLLNAFGTFYLPLGLMCGMYLLIFRVAREQVSPRGGEWEELTGDTSCSSSTDITSSSSDLPSCSYDITSSSL